MLEEFIRHQPKEGDAAYDISQVQEALIRVLDQITKQPALDTVLLKGVSITAGVENLITHGLERPFVGFYPTRPNVAAKVFEKTPSTANLSIFLPLDSDVDVTTDLVVF